MRGIVVTEYGAQLESRELADPQLLPGHALIEVLACGVCYSDVKIARGRMPFSADLPLPHVPGHEICGRVLATDPPGTIEPGTRVVVYNVWPCGRCDRCLAGDEQICRDPQARAGFTDPGGFRERMTVPVERLLKVPDGIDSAHAAPMTCALGTAYRAVVTRAGALPGTRVAVIGLGGVGIHALQIARAAGALAVGVDRSPAALEVAHGLGLTALHAQDTNLTESLLARTQGLGYDAVIDTVGRPQTIELAISLLRPGGRIVAVGYAVDQDFQAPSAKLVLEELQLVGSRYARRSEMEQAIRLVANGSVKMIVDEVLPLQRADDAFAALERGEVVGRLVLDVTEGRDR